MPSKANFSYQKLSHSSWLEDEDDFLLRERVIRRAKSWPKVRRVHIKRRLIRVKIPSLRRFFRRKSRAFLATWNKVLKRLKDSQAHFGDLFAGNYLFTQIAPTPIKYGADRHFKGHDLGGFKYGADKHLKGHDLGGFSYRCSFPAISQ